MKYQGFVGPAYTLDSVNVDCQRCVNLYPELIESGTGKEGAVAYLTSTPGLEFLLTVGSGPIRMIHVDKPTKHALNPKTRIFVASGAEMYKVTKVAGVWTANLLGPLNSSTGPVRAASTQINLGVTMFVDGVDNYLFWKFDNGDGTAPEDFGPFSDFGYASIEGATHVVWIDGYFIFNQKDTGKFYVSEWNEVSFDPLSFASAEGSLDNIVAMIANNRELVIVNEETTETFANTGNAAFPFERTTFIEQGSGAPYSVAKMDGTVFMIGKDEFGKDIVYAAKGSQHQRISTHAVERAMKSYADTSTATAYTYQSGGHFFYVLNFAEATWVYDLSTKLWHERAYTDAGDLVRHRGECHAFIPEFNIHMIGDWENGKIYQFNDSLFSDDGVAMTRLRSAPHISNSKKLLFFNRLEIDMETGVGLDGAVQGSDPQVMMDFSNDGGHTWSSESWVSAGGKVGAIGDYRKRVYWNKLGKAYDRVFRIKITDPVKVNIIGAEIEIEGGRN